MLAVCFNMGGKEQQGVGGMKGYIYSSSCDFLVQLLGYNDCDAYPTFCYLTYRKWPSLHLAQPTGTSSVRSLETGYSNWGEESLRHRVLLLHHTQLLPIRPPASHSKLSSSHIVPTLQPSNTATTMPTGRKSTCNRCHRISVSNGSGPSLRIWVLVQPELATRLRFDGKLPTNLNWVGCQRIAQRVHQ